MQAMYLNIFDASLNNKIKKSFNGVFAEWDFLKKIFFSKRLILGQTGGNSQLHTKIFVSQPRPIPTFVTFLFRKEL